MLTKHLANSESLSQQPLVILPVDYLARLTKQPAALPRNLLPDRTRKEPQGRNALVDLVCCLH